MLLTATLLVSALAAAEPSADWRLVAAYDASSTASAVGLPRPSFVWPPDPPMAELCGPAKAPMGLGLREAEAIALGTSPVLALVLEQVGPDAPGLTNRNVRVSLGQGAYLLQPAVEPRGLRVRVHASGAARELLRATQLVQTQLAMELCLEHKTGRGWLGQDRDRLRQAFLLDPPDGGHPDRMYFGGQRDPVPALLGPPDACFVREPGPSGGEAASGGRGDSTLSLVPSDVWGASLRWCPAELQRGDLRRTDRGAQASAPLRLSGELEGGAPTRPGVWRDLVVEVSAPTEDSPPRLRASLDETVLLADAPVFADDSENPGLTDVLAEIPYEYPSLLGAGRTYTVLLIPNWQLVEGLRRLESGTPERPLPTGGGEVRDGVTWVLTHPELLSVQVPTQAGAAEEDWYDLATTLRGGPKGVEGWGYATGLLASRSPVALAVSEAVPWDAAALAQRATPAALLLGGAGALVVLMLAGLRRLPELWLPVPEERASYWPGLPREKEEEPENPETDVVGGPPKS